MNTSIKSLLAMFVVAVSLGCCFTRAQSLPPECAANNGIDFKIVTDRATYSPKSIMHVKFLITNREDEPLYLFAGMSHCTSQIGFYWLTLLDKDGRPVPIQRCSADLDMSRLDALEELNNVRTGVRLAAWEIYGREGDFQLPAKKGTYRLETELFIPRLPENQLQALAARHMRVLQSQLCRVSAPAVTITVK